MPSLWCVMGAPPTMRNTACKARSTFHSTKWADGRLNKQARRCVNCMLTVVPILRNGWLFVPDLGRAAATAHAFADPLGLEVHPDARVRERSFGDWEGISVEELAQRYPEDYRSWAEFRGGELKYGAEPKEEVGRRGVEALNDWAFRAGRDTDLYVFSHGAWISQTLQTLLGMADAHGDFADILSMRNAHWVRLIPLEIGSALRWRLMDYNHGPAIADTEEWEHPNL